MDDESTLTDIDRLAIVAVASEYILSWLDGDAERLGRCLHPQLAKRMVDPAGQPGSTSLIAMGADELLEGTVEGHGRRYGQAVEVDILDAYPPIASVRVRSVPFVEYLHLGRFGDRWLVLNVVWQRRPGFVPRS